MNRREQLQTILEDLIGPREDEKQNVYFQPPATIKMVYPCIVYTRSSGRTIFADNNPYKMHIQYTITVIDPSPVSEISEKVASLQLCSYDRHYSADNLNHDVFNIYF